MSRSASETNKQDLLAISRYSVTAKPDVAAPSVQPKPVQDAELAQLSAAHLLLKKPDADSQPHTGRIGYSTGATGNSRRTDDSCENLRNSAGSHSRM